MPRLFRFLMLAVLASGLNNFASADDGARAPTYQRSRAAYHQAPRHAYGQHYGYAPQASGSYFQRPYPYHLDYYRMRWGGSYAPYFGNLYGPPNVVLGAPYPAYYGGYGYGYPAGTQMLPAPVVEAPDGSSP